MEDHVYRTKKIVYKFQLMQIGITYNRNPLIEEKRRALQALSDHVEAIVTGKVAHENVVELRVGV